MSATRENKEALRIPDSTKDIETNRVNEKVIQEENSTRIINDTYGDSFILGSASNGILGTSELGASARVETLVSVVNPNNTFRERFSDATFEDTGTTTADWADTVGTLVMTNTEVAQSLACVLNDGTIRKATISVEVSAGSITNLTFELSANADSDFESVTHNTEHAFTTTGVDLRFKITASDSVTITLVKITYE